MKSKLWFRSGLILFPLLVMCLILNVWGDRRDMSVSEESLTAFVNVNVIPMNSERILEKHTVIVKNGLVEKIGPAQEVQIPEGGVRIDGSGKYLMPGIADMHVHAWGENGTQSGNCRKCWKIWLHLTKHPNTALQISRLCPGRVIGNFRVE